MSLQGNDHVMYNGSFFYFHLESESVIKFDLNTRFSKRVKIPRNRMVVMNGGDLLTQLYMDKQKVIVILDPSLDA